MRVRVPSVTQLSYHRKEEMSTKAILIVCVCIAALVIGCSEQRKVNIEANVLSINCQILEGKLIGQFLGSSSGFITSDVIKVGVSFTINGQLFLRDLKLNHAQLAYYKDRSTLPLKIEIRRSMNADVLKVGLNGIIVDKLYLRSALVKKLLEKG